MWSQRQRFSLLVHCRRRRRSRCRCASPNLATSLTRRLVDDVRAGDDCVGACPGHLMFLYL